MHVEFYCFCRCFFSLPVSSYTLFCCSIRAANGKILIWFDFDDVSSEIKVLKESFLSKWEENARKIEENTIEQMFSNGKYRARCTWERKSCTMKINFQPNRKKNKIKTSNFFGIVTGCYGPNALSNRTWNEQLCLCVFFSFIASAKKNRLKNKWISDYYSKRKRKQQYDVLSSEQSSSIKEMKMICFNEWNLRTKNV